MPSPETQFTESFVYEGALRWPLAIGVFILLAALIGWLLWRERNITGRPMASLFFVVRLAAVSLVLWMLLGPTSLTTKRTTINQTLAIIVDSSQSMDVAEPMQKLERLRWQQAAGGESQNHLELSQIDAALLALRHAAASIRQVSTGASEFASAQEIATMFEVAKKSTERASHHLTEVGQSLKTADTDLSRRASDSSEELQGQAAPAIDKLAAAWKKGPSTDAADQLAVLTEHYEQWLRHAEMLERNVLDHVVTATDKTSSVEQTPPSRKELLTKAMERLEQGVLAELSKTMSIKRIRFDEFATMLTGDSPWREALQPSMAKPAAKSADADSDEPQSLDFGPATNLAAPLEMLRQDASAESISAAVILSDGGHNSLQSAEPRVVAEGLSGLPVYVTPVGSQEPLRDLILHRVSAPSSVALDDKIVLEALITGQYLSGEEVTIELRHSGQLVEQRRLAFNSDRQDHHVKFTIPADELGLQEFDLVAPPLADEISSNNNSAVVAVRVVRDTTRILLADRLPRWEYRYLDQLFRRDKHVQCDKLLQQPVQVATGKLEVSKELPRDVEGWSNYDVVILGDLQPSTFDGAQQKSLEEWVRKRGGAIIVIAGEECMPHDYQGTPLIGMLPAQESPQMKLDRNGYLPVLTREGAANESLMLADTQTASVDLWMDQFRSVPIYFLSNYCHPKPAAHVLIGATPAGAWIAVAGETNSVPDQALLSWQDVGAGRVVYLASPVSYHLRFRRGDELHHRFWGQLLRWLTAADRGKGQSQIFVKAPKSRYNYGEPIEVITRLANEDGSPIQGVDVSAQAKSPTGEPVTVPLTPDANVPGRYFGQFEKLSPGAYRISAVGDAAESIAAPNSESQDATMLVTVTAPENLEMSSARGNRALLREIAEVTGGQVVPPDAVGEMLELSALAPRVIENSVRTPLWDRWLYFWVVVGCLMTEWIARRWVGLV